MEPVGFHWTVVTELMLVSRRMGAENIVSVCVCLERERERLTIIQFMSHELNSSIVEDHSQAGQFGSTYPLLHCTTPELPASPVQSRSTDNRQQAESVSEYILLP